MDDFLYILKLQLEGRLSDDQITDQMHIYEDYIQEQVAGGKTMEQVMRKLGDPAKVADMIVEHYEKLEKQQQRESIGNMTAGGDQCECSESGAWISCRIYRE